MVIPFMTMYCTQKLHFSLPQAGTVMALFGGGAIVGAYFGGKITDKTGKPVGSRERKRLKDEVLTDLLPRAFTRLSKRTAYMDTENGWLVIDTASRKAAEAVTSLIREALGSFPAAPLVPDESPRVLMTDWLAKGKLPKGLALGDECELRDSGDAGAVVRARRQDLESDEIREHLKSGKQVFQLGLTFDERLGFSLDEDLVVRKLKFLDFAKFHYVLSYPIARKTEYLANGRPADPVYNKNIPLK